MQEAIINKNRLQRACCKWQEIMV